MKPRVNTEARYEAIHEVGQGRASRDRARQTNDDAGETRTH